MNITEITLTNAPPIRIREDEWPVLAESCYQWHDGIAQHATRAVDIDIRIREHADGRLLVYGVYDFDTTRQEEKGVVTRAGKFFEAGADQVAAINEVGAILEAQVADVRPEDAANVRVAVDCCISNLPMMDV
jgi:hypothetical protein